MTTTAPSTNGASPKWAMLGIGLGAFAAVLIGNVDEAVAFSSAQWVSH